MELQTKQDFQTLALRILNPLKPLYSPGGARLHLGDTGATYDRQAIELEAFSRPLWALAPFWAGGGTDAGFAAIYAHGLANGPYTASPEYWGGFADYDQRFVEMAAIATALLLAPEHTWHCLSDSEKSRLAAWLDGINHFIIPDCNWHFFRVLVNLALQKREMPFSAENLQASLAKIDSYYIGDGWYQDGASSQKDYYIPFALHYYGLLYAKVMEQDDPLRSAQFKQRAELFAKDFLYWFAPGGAALPFGRSLTYRWAQCSFFSACLFAGIEPLPLPVMKGIIVRNLQWWLRYPIFDRDGVLTIGYTYPNLIMAERYNAPGSPYWGMKTFLLLALPDTHPFWNAKPAPLPPLKKVKVLPKAEMLIQRFPHDVVALVPGVCEQYGHGHVPEKYAKFAYSTAFGFSCARSNLVLHEAAPDSMLAFVIDDTVLVRKYSTQWEVSGNGITAVWSPFPGIKVTTTLSPLASGHKRRHEVESEYNCFAVDYGFAVPRFSEAGFYATTQGNTACVATEKHRCTVTGSGAGATGEVLIADPNTNILVPNTAIPGVRYQIKKGFTTFNTIITALVQ